jgi:transposase
MEQRQSSTRIAGVDVGKKHLDAAIHGLEDNVRVDNTKTGIGELIAWLRDREGGRVGMEASGGYERGVRSALEQTGFEVVLHQPLEVRRFAQLKRRRAKNDRLDAQLIAAATAQTDTVRAAQDPRLVELADRLTAYEHVTDQIVAMKTFLESVSLGDIRAMLRGQLRSMERAKAKLAADIVQRIKAATDLLARFRLLLSLPGVGPIVAASLLIRMPELGAMRRGQAACLIGVAPFDRESGQWKGLRFISGGRSRPRRLLYLAALVARRLDPALKALADRLRNNGKPPKVAIVAVMRKLIEAANLVLARATPWLPNPAA